MKRNWWFRFSLLLVLTVISVAVLIPTVMKKADNDHYPIKSKISLGLDLQGGLYMILGIDFNKVYKDEVVGYGRKVVSLLKDKEIVASVGDLDESNPKDPKQWVELSESGKVDEAKEKVRAFFAGTIRLTATDGKKLQYALNDAVRTRIEEQSVGKSIEVIRNRIDEFGVSEPEIISQGRDRIIIQLPGVKDIERAKALIGKTAKLEFKIVNDTVSAAQVSAWMDKVRSKGIIYQQSADTRFSDYVSSVNAALKEDLPKGYEIAFQKTMNKFTNKITDQVPYLVESLAHVSGDDLADASVQFDQQKGEPYVSLEFKSAGAKSFEEVTGGNIGKRLAVILDGNVYTAPHIQARIGGGRAQITLGYGDAKSLMDQARDIALVLRAGALPVQLDFLEQRVVGPSLGQDSIKKANIASIIGCMLVAIFIVIYYRFSGVIAVVTLCLNVIFMIACLAGFAATLTLPGIAGIALTVGMAVDANIVIYERIREEKRKGISNLKSVEAGFHNAFWTIIDANITNALAGLALLNFGTGPIRGFAVTLLIGIACTVYTAFFVTKVFFELYMDKVEGQDLSI